MSPLDAARISRVIAEPMGGRIQLSLRHAPGHAAPSDHEIYVLLESENGRLTGVGCRKVLDIWFNGSPARVGYLHHFRGATGIGRRFKDLQHGFDLILNTRSSDELPWDLTSIAADNKAARRLLERGLPGMPTYRRLCEYTTFILRTRRLGIGSRKEHPTTDESTDEIELLQQRYGQSTQFAPQYHTDHLMSIIPAERWVVVRRDGRLRAAAGIWDKRPFYQVAVAGYDPILRAVRIAYNLLAKATGAPVLPPVGSQMRLGFLAFAMFDAVRQADLSVLLRHCLACAKQFGLDYIAFGCAEGNPLLPVLDQFRPWRLATIIYTVARNNETPPRPLDYGALIGLEAALL